MTGLSFASFPALDWQCCLLLTYGLVHFLWQGCLLTFMFALVRRLPALASANRRYAAGVVTLVLMATCLPVTLALVEPASFATAQVDGVQVDSAPQAVGVSGFDQAALDSAELPPTAPPLVAHPPAVVPSNKPAFWLAPLQLGDAALAAAAVYATAAYAAGLALMLARMFVGLTIGRGLRRRATPVTDLETLEFVRRQASRLALRAVPSLAWCGRVSVPVVVGVLRPMILLPASLVTGLTARQLELILLHELAHIHRYDPLVNLLQRLIEAVLFFHPAVWWLSRQVSLEREQACDDAVLRAGSDGPAYADALLRVAELCAALSSTAAGPTGALAAINRDKNQLRRRILRLLAADRPAPLRPAAPAAAMLALLFAGAILALAAWRSPATAQLPDSQVVDERPAIGAGNQPTAGEDQPANVAARVLHFPADRAMGFVWTRPASGDYATLIHHDALQPLGAARGDLEVPAGVDVHLYVANEASKDLTGLDGLAPDDVQFLSFRYTQVDGEGLRHVGWLTGLRSLNLMYAASIGDAGVEHLAGLKQLRAIRFDGLQARRRGGGIGDASLAGLPELRRVDVRRMPKITDAGLAELAPLKKLIELDLGGTGVTDVGLKVLRQFPALDNLDLGVYHDGAPISDAGLVEIGALIQLKSLNLGGTPITEAGLAHLASLSGLEILSLDDTNIPEAGLARLEPLQSLHMLAFRTSGNDRREIDDAGARLLARLKSLTRIDADLRLTDQGVSALATLAGLEQIELRGKGITDAAAEHLARMQHLKSLRLHDCPLGDAGLARVATLPALERLNLSETAITGKGLAALAQAKNLTGLSVEFNDRRELKHALRKIGKLTGLKNLNIWGAVETHGLSDLEGLHHLEQLGTDSPLDSVQASQIARLASLRMLVLRQSMITDSGLEELSRLAGLKVLHIEGYFTDKGLASLARLKALDNLDVGSPYVSQAAVDALAAGLPALQTIQVRDTDPLRQQRRRQGAAAPAEPGSEARSIKQTKFIGHTITTARRLETQIGAKFPVLDTRDGPPSEQQIQEHCGKLADYYRNLGFFRAKVSRQLPAEKNGQTPAIAFSVDEGPRHLVSAISFAGNRRFTAEQLSQAMMLKPSGFCLKRDLEADLARLKKMYADGGLPDADIRYRLRLDDKSAQVGVEYTVPE